MKKVKYFVLGLLVCFGCGPTMKQSENDLNLLITNIKNIESYQCTRSDIDDPFLCTINVTNELPKLVVCGNNGCIVKKCPVDYLCFQSSNDTE